MKIFELLERLAQYYFVGTCVNSFDEEGNCIVPALPWTDTTQFAKAKEHAKRMTKEQFYSMAQVPADITTMVSKNKVIYLKAGNVLMMHDLDSNVHYFFTE